MEVREQCLKTRQKDGKIMQIKETDEYKRLAVNFMENGLEIHPDDPVPPELVKCWKLIDDEAELPDKISDRIPDKMQKKMPDKISDGLVGGCVLCMREGEYIIDGIAVDRLYRDEDWGSRLLEVAIDEAKRRGGRKMYLVARAPGFFKKHGFGEVKREQAPEFFECFTCDQYNKTCFPQVMKYEF